MSYEPPIKIIMQQMNTEMMDTMLRVVQSYGFDVDQVELAKALIYDRDQYDKGYQAGYADRPRAKWEHCHLNLHGYKTGICTHCGERRIIDSYCQHCGAEMEAEAE